MVNFIIREIPSHGKIQLSTLFLFCAIFFILWHFAFLYYGLEILLFFQLILRDSLPTQSLRYI